VQTCTPKPTLARLTVRIAFRYRAAGMILVIRGRALTTKVS
jgi:hypothetical protein